MSSKMKSGRVIWAVDATAKESKLQVSTFKALSKILGPKQTSVEPVAVMGPLVEVPNASFAGYLVAQRNEIVQKLKKMVAQLKDRRIMPPTILTRDGISTQGVVDELLDYAHFIKAELIAVGSHSRTGLNRLVLGSFAETLLLKSDIPVLVINPTTKQTKAVKHLLFATDFSDASHEAFEQVVALAAQLKARVTLYSKIEYFVPQTFELMKVSHYQDYLESDKADRKRRGQKWCALAAKSKVKAELVLDDRPAYIAEGIVDTAKKKKADLIALASCSGKLETALIGSVVRKVVRLAKEPVWIVHPKSKKSTARQTHPKAEHKLRMVSGTKI